MAERVYRPACIMRFQIVLEDFKNPEDSAAATESKPGVQSTKALSKALDEAKESRAILASQLGNTSDPALLEQDAHIKKLESQLKGRQIEEQPQTRRQQIIADAAAANQPGEGQFTLQDVSIHKKHTAQPSRSKRQDKSLDEFNIELFIVPTEATVELNSFRIADTFSCSFPFRDAPLVNDIIRSATVEVYMGTLKNDDFADPANWRLLLSQPSTTLMFRGYVDTWEDKHDEESVVQLQARSLEAILIDAKIDPRKQARVKKPEEGIVEFVNNLLKTIPQVNGDLGGNQMQARLHRSTDEPKLSRTSLIRALQTAKSRNKAKTPDNQPVVEGETVEQEAGDTDTGSTVGDGVPNQHPPTAQQISAWDVITAACELVGFQPVYDPTVSPNDILIQPAQTLFPDVLGGVRIQGGAPDGFSRMIRESPDQPEHRSEVRLFVWGHNIKSMKRSRKLGRVKAQAIEVRCTNPDLKATKQVKKDKGSFIEGRTYVVRYPTTTRATTLVHGSKGKTKGSGGKVEEFHVMTVKGVRSLDALKQIAVDMYHSMSRQETSIHIETDDMTSFVDVGDTSTDSIPNNNPDVLRLRPGTPVRVEVAKQQADPSKGLVVEQLSEIYGLRGDALVAFLREQYGRFKTTDPLTAKLEADKTYNRIATAYEAAKLTSVYYCRTINHKFSIEDGWSGEIEVVNYIEARSDPKNLSIDDQKANAKHQEPTTVSPLNASAEERLAQALNLSPPRL